MGFITLAVAAAEHGMLAAAETAASVEAAAEIVAQAIMLLEQLSASAAAVQETLVVMVHLLIITESLSKQAMAVPILEVAAVLANKVDIKVLEELAETAAQVS